ncbi:UNKNOWN [Stylonychia lemnae]|uniref:Uncharacterized protein n=1 Tax=Stylonychia lemnae TaxID=5949 RepID=A0A078AXG9_STYLE|nr:UNKNOWN [Stylonychia lemnae]|eukprot:CDW85483.1 UNKNOWN [Stylonychia lemnae]
MKFCDDNGYFDPVMNQRLFEGSISLFQSAFFNTFQETRENFLQPNPSLCEASGYSQSQQQITSIQQLGNNENDFDENDNPDLVHYYENSNSQSANLETFIGNIVAFQRCSYVFCLQSISIEYDQELKRKRTTFNKKSEYTFQKAKSINDDFPCASTEFYYHPGIKGIIYLMDDNLTISGMYDAGFPENGDPCEQDLFTDTSWETIGLIYTKKDVKGYTVMILNETDYFESSITTLDKANTVFWKIHQSRVFIDVKNHTDFYNFTVQFGRYHAIVLNPGLCGQMRNTTDYNNMRAFVVNLRRMEIEKCLTQSLVGCGDGVFKSLNEEECDDGNLSDGDGCSSNCKIEEFYNCTKVEGKKSVCSPIICSNGKKDDGEECDDGNLLDGDGCNSTCKEEIGWSCAEFFTCKKMCGDEKIYQQNKKYANGSIYEFYREECDQVVGCNNETCRADLGWNCTQNMTDLTGECIQYCGNKHNESWELCDDGNNVGGDGCAKGCMEIEFPFKCPPVGKCSSSCGNRQFEGLDLSIGFNKELQGEECDDGNNVDGDGCSSACKKEEGYTCVNIFWKLVYELPIFYSSCTKSNGGGTGETNGTKVYYKYIQTETEFIFDDNSVNLRQLSGKFRLIETGDSENG